MTCSRGLLIKHILAVDLSIYMTMADPNDEETLIAAVTRVRLGGAETVAACHEALVGEFNGLTMGQVKKANSKAVKRAGGSIVPTAVKEEADKAAAAPPPVPVPVPSEKKAAKQAKQAGLELKSAENEMMDAQRRLRAAKTGGDMFGAVQVDGSVEDFVQRITAKAMSAVLEPGDEKHLKERVEADIAALEWVKLAQKAGVLKLTEDIVALGGELQLTRLKEVRDCRDVVAVLACYAKEGNKPSGNKEDGTEYADVDKMIKSTGALSGVAEPAAEDGPDLDID